MDRVEFHSEEQRYIYPLKEGDFVVDLGAYQGRWADEIERRYGCKVQRYEPVFDLPGAHNVAVSAQGGKIWFGVAADSTGAFAKTAPQQCVDSIPIAEVLEADRIALLKLNVEGMEYEILEEMIRTGDICRVDNLQVQFHACGVKLGVDVWGLIRRIEDTHDREWGNEPYLWMSFKKKPPEFQSQHGQDRFVWAVTGGLRKGSFLDIGCEYPRLRNNTYALERMGWNGLRFDMQPKEEAGVNRRSPLHVCDATLLGWQSDLLDRRAYTYMSLDVDEYDAVVAQRFPFGERTFSVITAEHDAYRFGGLPRDSIRQRLDSYGYKLICKDVTSDGLKFEDWWVSAELEQAAQPFKCEGKDWKEIVGCS